MLHPRGIEPSPELREALAKHRIGVRRASSSYDALAQVCALLRDGPIRPVVLLLAHPAKLDGADVVYEAAQTYAGKAACWMYDPSSTPRLRGVTPEDARAWTRNPVSRLIASPEPTGSARAAVTFVGPGFPRTPVVPAAPSTEPRPGAAGPSMPTKPVARQAPRFVGGSWDGGTSSFPGTAVPRHALTDEELAMLLADRPS